MLALGIHEAGHLAGSRLLRQPIGDFHLAPFGIAARLPETHRPGRTKRCLVIAAGPLANLLAFGIFAWMDRFGTAFQVMAVSNLLMAAFNLLPALPMDGGWLIYHLLETMIDEMAAIRGMLGLTAVTGLFLTGAGIFQVLVSRGNASLLLAGGFILYTAWKEAPQVRIMRTARLLMRNMDGKGPPVPGRATLTVAPSCSRPADIFRFFSQNRCNLVLVLDETREMKPMGLLSETRLGRIALSGNRQETLGQILTDENRQRDGWM
ncbi:MAG TPA: hypothetical protein DD727_04055 [Clostridiales bacterium]|nr:hypothetical protein [Clostridiales bacterium]